MPQEVRNLEAVEELIDQLGPKQVILLVADVCRTKAVAADVEGDKELSDYWHQKADKIFSFQQGLGVKP